MHPIIETRPGMDLGIFLKAGARNQPRAANLRCRRTYHNLRKTIPRLEATIGLARMNFWRLSQDIADKPRVSFGPANVAAI